MIYILKAIEGNTVSYIKYKTLQEAEQQLVMWQKEDKGTGDDTIHTFASWQGAFSFMFTEANNLGSTDNAI